MSVVDSLFIAIPVLLWATIIVFEFKKKNSGTLLLEIGPRKKKEKLVLILSGFLVLVSLWELNEGDYLKSGLIFALSLGTFVMHWGKVQLKEGGISTGFGFLYWDQIGYYGWADKTLLLKPKHPGLMCWSAHLSIPEEQQEAIQNILSQYLGEH